MAEPIEPERSNPGGWIPWVATVVGLLAFVLVFTMLVMGGDRDVGVIWLVIGGGALLAATLLIPAWAIFGLRQEHA